MHARHHFQSPARDRESVLYNGHFSCVWCVVCVREDRRRAAAYANSANAHKVLGLKDCGCRRIWMLCDLGKHKRTSYKSMSVAWAATSDEFLWILIGLMISANNVLCLWFMSRPMQQQNAGREDVWQVLFCFNCFRGESVDEIPIGID